VVGGLLMFGGQFWRSWRVWQRNAVRV